MLANLPNGSWRPFEQNRDGFALFGQNPKNCGDHIDKVYGVVETFWENA
jgi:hypothetical protein